MIQKAIKEGRLKFEDKKGNMKVDANPFEVSSSFAEPALISTNVAEIRINPSSESRQRWADEVKIDHFEAVEKPIFPIAGESLIEFLSRQCNAKGDVSLCPSCSAVYDGNAVKEYEQRKLDKKMAEEFEKDRLKRKLTGKQIDFGPFDPKFVNVE